MLNGDAAGSRRTNRPDPSASWCRVRGNTGFRGRTSRGTEVGQPDLRRLAGQLEEIFAASDGGFLFHPIATAIGHVEIVGIEERPALLVEANPDASLGPEVTGEESKGVNFGPVEIDRPAARGLGLDGVEPLAIARQHVGQLPISGATGGGRPHHGETDGIKSVNELAFTPFSLAIGHVDAEKLALVISELSWVKVIAVSRSVVLGRRLTMSKANPTQIVLPHRPTPGLCIIICITYNMLVVKDAMVLIHLAKTSLLDAAVDYFEQVSIPSGVHEETVVAGKKHDYPDAEVIAELIDTGRIEVASDIESSLVERANRYNIQGGEAEAVALYWQRDAELLATDDDNVRRKRTVLELDLIGTPAILLELSETAHIDASKATATIDELRSIGWFSTALLDTVELEAGLT